LIGKNKALHSSPVFTQPKAHQKNGGTDAPVTCWGFLCALFNQPVDHPSPRRTNTSHLTYSQKQRGVPVPGVGGYTLGSGIGFELNLVWVGIPKKFEKFNRKSISAQTKAHGVAY
jgi:hypothetical protein